MGATAKRAQPGHHARALLAAGVLFTVGTAGHAMASGSLPSVVGVVVAGALAWALAFGFAERRRHWMAALALVAGTQGVMHVVLSATDGHGGHAGGSASMTAMLVAHAVAAVGGLLVIRFGDALIAAWMRFTSSVLGADIISLPTLAEFVGVPALTSTRHHRLNLRVAAWSLRGPPLAA